MSEKKSSFPYAKTIKSLPFIAFIRRKTPQGIYSYEFPTLTDLTSLGFSSSEEAVADTEGCLQAVLWSDKPALAQSISDSQETMTASEEQFCLVSSFGKMSWFVGGGVPAKQSNGDIVWKGFWLDITAEKQKDYFNSLVLESIHEGVVAFDKQGIILSASPSALNILSSEKDIVTKSIFSLLPDDIAETLQQNMLLSALKDKTTMRCFITKDNKKCCLEIDMVQKESFFVCIFRDISAFYKQENDLRNLAYHDVNTGIKNLTYLQDIFPELLEKAKVSQTQIAVLAIRPDSLGQLKALTNQKVRSQTMLEISKRISDCLSKNDVLTQTGEYTFTALITDLDFTLEVENKIEDILKSFKEPLFVADLVFDITVSIGLCFCTQDGVVLSDLLSRSKMALDKANACEKSSMRIYNNEYSIKAAINLNMRQSLRKALSDKRISAYYQPQVDIKTGQIVGLEALARWETEEGMLIPPAEFIPEAEEYGLIDELTEIILDCACKNNQRWYSMGLCRVPIAVNISARQFHNETQLLCMIDKALDESGLPAYLLELELTESSAMYDPKNAERIIQTLLDNNIRCALDDFGTGYSSLSVLSSFPLKKLKIDRSFILRLHEKKNIEIVRATIAMAHALNLSILAEGVENRKAFEILKELNCDIIQGYLFSRPLSAQQTEQMLMRWDANTASEGFSF